METRKKRKNNRVTKMEEFVLTLKRKHHKTQMKSRK
jgi:hypothetical protein